jgi:hypothetical protein
MARNLKPDPGCGAVPSPLWVIFSQPVKRLRLSVSLEEQPAIVIGDKGTEQSHEVSNGESKGSNGKVGPIASAKGQRQVKKPRIEHQRDR